MIEWVDRLTDVKTLSIDENGYYVRHKSSFNELTPNEIIESAKKYGAQYVLVKFDDEKLAMMLEAGASVFDSQGKWTVLQVK